MYEDTTYEVILDRMLRRVRDDSLEMDTRQSSPIYTSLAPTAVELQNAYIGLDWTLDQMFASTATREYLIRRCAEWDITPHPATKAVLKGEFNIDIEIGSRFSLGTLNYVAIDRMEEGIYRMECETAGAVGSRELGMLVPIDYIQGLTKAELTGIIEDGSDEESTKALLERYLTKVQKPSTSGNRHDYYNWAMECEGVGAAKVFPLAGGPGTVKVIIADANMSAAGTGVLKMVREHIEELRPIGADVTVVQNAFQAALTEYLHKEALDLSYVSLARVGNLLLGTEGVEDYSNLLLNGVSGNVALTEDEIAVTGTVALEVM